MKGDADPSLKRLNRLKPSAMMSNFKRSPIRTARISRMSSDMNRCVMPMLRPRLPDENTPLVINGVHPVAPGTHNVPSDNTEGRSVWFDWSLFVSWLLRILNGRPDEISKIGARVKSERNLCQPSPPRQPTGDASTPLNTKRWR